MTLVSARREVVIKIRYVMILNRVFDLYHEGIR
ncbi:MAG: hypothetical protein RJA57_1071 [Bacteroidota bacterium]|jgi:hypothetical protein